MYLLREQQIDLKKNPTGNGKVDRTRPKSAPFPKDRRTPHDSSGGKKKALDSKKVLLESQRFRPTASLYQHFAAAHIKPTSRHKHTLHYRAWPAVNPPPGARQDGGGERCAAPREDVKISFRFHSCFKISLATGCNGEYILALRRTIRW